MRVLFLTHRLPYAPNRGDRIRAYYLMREIATFAKVSLFSLAHDAEEAAHAGDVPFVDRVEIGRVRRLRNLARGVVSLPSSRPLTHALLDAAGARAALERLVRDAPPDVVLAYCSGMARFAIEPPLDRFPCVLDMVDVDSQKWAALAERSGSARRWLYRREARTLGRFETTAVAHARTTLVVNERERDLLRTSAPTADIRVLPNGIDVDAFAPPGPLADSSRVVFCGVMSYEPNVEAVRWFAEQVWPRVRAASPEARFVIVGSDPAPAVRALARDESIEVTGAVPAVQPYLWNAALSVSPLHVSRGVQNKVLEAVAAGLPAIVTPAVHEGLPPAARPACTVAHDAPAWAAAVVDCLKQAPECRRRIAQRAQVRELAWERQLEPLEEILRRAL